MEENITFEAGNITLEGILEKNQTPKGVALVHPHPMYGGNMYDYVVTATANAFKAKGYTTLKFNLRGVGNSQGQYDNGIGEQEDIKSAVTYLANLGLKSIDLAGYSFGTWVISQLDHASLGINDLYYVSPPMGLMDFGEIKALNKLKLVVTGSRDEYAPASVLKRYLEKWNPSARLEIIEGSDHFYGGFHRELEGILSTHI